MTSISCYVYTSNNSDFRNIALAKFANTNPAMATRGQPNV